MKAQVNRINNKIAAIRDRLAQAEAYRDAYMAHASLMEAVIAKGDPRRLARADSIVVVQAAFGTHEGSKRILAVIQGSTGSEYKARITVAPKRGYHCTCPDSQNRGREGVGPCKHVLALARHWLNEEIVPALEKVEADLP